MQRYPGLSALCSVAILCASVSSDANADGYPSRHVSIITQAAAGSGPDVIGRIIADRLTHSWDDKC